MTATLFFLASKFVGLALMVESLLVVGMVIALVALWAGAIKLAAASLAGALLLLVMVLSPLTDILLYQIEKTYPANPDLSGSVPIHGLIILGGSTIPHQTHAWQQVQMNEAGERVTAGILLAKQRPDVRLLLTGGSDSPINALMKNKVASEAAMTRDLMLAMGLDDDRIMIEEASRNTAENAMNSAVLAGDTINRRWVLVTSAFHMPRAVRSFQRAGWTDIIPYPVDHRTDPANFASNWHPLGKLNRANLVIKEWVGQIVYGLTGR